MRIRSIGLTASRLLEHAGSACVWGRSRRGLFLQLSDKQVLFLSCEADPGPLTINLEGEWQALDRLATGSKVVFGTKTIEFPLTGIILPTTDARIWSPSPPSGWWLTHAGREAFLQSACEIVLEGAPVSPIIELLPYIAGKPTVTGEKSPAYLPLLEAVLQACELHDATRTCQALGAFLGLGRGLTPSGDDLVSGFLLAINRWESALSAGWEKAKLNSCLVQLALERTNTISANLIECASLGLADERLIMALEALMTGNTGPQECLQQLSGWGNSSGLDSLVGMALASQACLV